MDPVDENLKQSLTLVRRLLANSFSRESGVPVVETHPFATADSESNFDAKGSSRIEILFDSVTIDDKKETMVLHGLVENCKEERKPLLFFCETEWADRKSVQCREVDNEQALKSLVIDFVDNSQQLSSAEFGVTFKRAGDGQVIGWGEGYLRFEREAALIPA